MRENKREIKTKIRYFKTIPVSGPKNLMSMLIDVKWKNKIFNLFCNILNLLRFHDKFSNKSTEFG